MKIKNLWNHHPDINTTSWGARLLIINSPDENLMTYRLVYETLGWKSLGVISRYSVHSSWLEDGELKTLIYTSYLFLWPTNLWKATKRGPSCRFLQSSLEIPWDLCRDAEDSVSIATCKHVFLDYPPPPPKKWTCPRKRGTISKGISSSNHWCSGDVFDFFLGEVGGVAQCLYTSTLITSESSETGGFRGDNFHFGSGHRRSALIPRSKWYINNFSKWIRG